jgi:hypothetical protein
VEGNFIGTDASGAAGLGTRGDGIWLHRAPSNTIGGAAPGAGNLISGNTYGVFIFSGAASNNTVQGNRIGTQADGVNPLPNVFGVVFAAGASGNLIGGRLASGGNLIAHCLGYGVSVDAVCTNNAVLGNAIFANGGSGIDLGIDGITPNDAGDADGGPNGLQNFPALISATTGSTTTTILGTLNTVPNTTFRLEFFDNASLAPNAPGQGHDFLGAIDATTDISGNVAFSFVPSSVVAAGHFITATATDPMGNTSEFSKAVLVRGPLGGVRVEGRGSIIPLEGLLIAVPDRYYRFAGWSDGVTNSPRSGLVIGTNELIAYFTPLVPLEGRVFQQWDRSSGGTNADIGGILAKTSDGGYVVGGYSYSEPSGNKTSSNFGDADFWLTRLNANGDTLWDRAFGGSSAEFLNSVRATADGGFILAGFSDSATDGNKTSPNLGLSDFWIVRLDADGNKLWDRSFGGSRDDVIIDLIQTSDGGFAFTGSSWSTNGTTIPTNFGFSDTWVVRLDVNGELLWERSFGGDGWDQMQRIQQTADGGFLLVGASDSNPSGNKTSPHFGEDDAWILRLDAVGNKVWEISYGGEQLDSADAFAFTVDGGILVAGNSASGTTGNKTSVNFGGFDFWLLRLDGSGNKLWERTYGGSGQEALLTMRLAQDGGALLGGESNSGSDGNKSAGNYGDFDAWLVRVDADGNKLWDYSLGGSRGDFIADVLEAGESDIVLGAVSSSFSDGTKTAPNWGEEDYWVVNLATRIAPVGTPAILVDGVFHPTNNLLVSNAVTIEMQTTLVGGAIFYTLDGFTPTVAYGTLYTGPFLLSDSVVIRAVAFGPGFTPAVEADPFTIIVRARPVIVAGPSSQTVIVSSEALIAVSATGATPLSYQWLLDGAPLSHATNSTLTLNNVQLSQAGGYSLVLSNAFGVVTSTVAVLTVLTPPSISARPVDVSVPPGSNVTFCVTATGTPPLLYRWRLNGVAIPGGTNACLTLSDVQVANGGSYTVAVANEAGVRTTEPVLLVVEIPPAQPRDDFAERLPLTGTNGLVFGTNTLATLQTGEPVHNGKPNSHSVWYTWHAPTNGVATFDTLGSAFDTVLAIYTGTFDTLTPVASDDDGSAFYASHVRFMAVAETDYAIAIAGYGEASGRFILHWTLEHSPEIVPRIILAPTSMATDAGGSATFSVITGPPGVTYQWTFQGTAIVGATDPSFIRTNVQVSDVGSYTVRLSHTNNPGLVIETAPVSLEIGPVATVVSKSKVEELLAAEALNPTPRIGAGRDAFWPASQATSGGFISVQLGGFNRQVLDTNSYSSRPVPPSECNVLADDRKRWFGLRAVTNGTLALDDVGAGINTVIWAYRYPFIGAFADNLVACDINTDSVGSQVKFDVNISGGKSYQDYVVAIDTVGASLLVTNSDGSTNLPGSVRLNWRLGHPPLVTSLSPDQIVTAGSNVVLSIQATNVYSTAATNRIPLPVYQWYRNEQLLSQMTNATLPLTNVQPTDAGAYTVVASNWIGAVSRTIRLGVVVASNAARTVAAGGPTTLETAVTAAGCPTSYQWRLNGAAIPGRTNQILELNNTLLSSAGEYSIVVSNCFGAVTALVATVSVQAQFQIGFCGVRELGTIQFPPVDAPACGVVIEYANELTEPQTNWQPLATNLNVTAPLCIPALSNATALPRGFYRARLAPCR